MKSFILISTLLLSTTVFAEYRVYQYEIKPTYETLQEAENYVITSTLDPVSYLSYHGGAQSIKINLLRTWMCKGHTGGQREHCKSPLELSMNQVGQENP